MSDTCVVWLSESDQSLPDLALFLIVVDSWVCIVTCAVCAGALCQLLSVLSPAWFVGRTAMELHEGWGECSQLSPHREFLFWCMVLHSP